MEIDYVEYFISFPMAPTQPMTIECMCDVSVGLPTFCDAVCLLLKLSYDPLKKTAVCVHMTSIHTSLMLGHLPLYHVLAFWCFVYVAWFIFETEIRECYIYTVHTYVL